MEHQAAPHPLRSLIPSPQYPIPNPHPPRRRACPERKRRVDDCFQNSKAHRPHPQYPISNLHFPLSPLPHPHRHAARIDLQQAFCYTGEDRTPRTGPVTGARSRSQTGRHGVLVPGEQASPHTCGCKSDRTGSRRFSGWTGQTGSRPPKAFHGPAVNWDWGSLPHKSPAVVPRIGPVQRSQRAETW